jgi:hypothetical protein
MRSDSPSHRWWRPLRHASALLALVATIGASSSAFAQGKPVDPKDRARDLFRDGAAAVEEGKPADGLPKLLEAESLFHAPTHVLYIARAQAALGKLMDAQASYKKLAEEKLAAKASSAFKEAQATAQKELPELERRIPKVLVKPEPADAEELAVVMNGATLESGRIGATFAVDPGQYTFEGKAKGLEAQKVIVDAAERTTTEVRLLLRPLGSAPVEGGQQTVIVRGEDGSVTSGGGDGWGGVRIASLPMMGVGGAGLVVGGVLVGLHFAKSGEADDQAACAPACTPAQVADIESLDSEAASFGTGGIIALSAGGALLAGGVVMYFVGGDSGGEPEAQAPAVARLQVVPILGPGFVGAAGTF